MKKKNEELEIQNTFNMDTIEVLNDDVEIENVYESEVLDDEEENN